MRSLPDATTSFSPTPPPGQLRGPSWLSASNARVARPGTPSRTGPRAASSPARPAAPRSRSPRPAGLAGRGRPAGRELFGPDPDGWGHATGRGHPIGPGVREDSAEPCLLLRPGPKRVAVLRRPQRGGPDQGRDVLLRGGLGVPRP